jgi:hypothetical protein
LFPAFRVFQEILAISWISPSFLDISGDSAFSPNMHRTRDEPAELRDLRYGLRTLRKNSAFTAAAILSLSLGIGVNTLVFSVFDSLLLRPLPIAHRSRRCLSRRKKAPAILFQSTESFETIIPPVIFRSSYQDYNSTTTIVVKSRRPGAEVVEQIRKQIATMDARLPVYGTGSLVNMLGFALFPMHAAAIALSAFGILAILLAVTGIPGLVAYAVARRTRELGIRIAVGARSSEVLRLVLGKLALCWPGLRRDLCWRLPPDGRIAPSSTEPRQEIRACC